MSANKLGWLVPVIAATQMGATDCGQVTKDPGFDLWCGDTLCDWRLERGDVARVATWNEGDPGVQFVGDDVAISQVTPVASTDGTCIEFSMIADVALDAHVALDVDIGDDNTVEDTEDVPTTDWKPIKFLIRIVPPYSGVKFTIRKSGTGEAILAQLEARISDECNDALPAVEPGPPGFGAVCDAEHACDKGTCSDAPFGEGTQCEQCTPGTCLNNTVCGAVDAYGPFVEPHAGCVPANSKALGDVCLTDSECESGICNGGACSTCVGASGCTGSEACAAAWVAPPGSLIGPLPHNPHECSPNQGLRMHGESCVNDADCGSGRCDGAAHSMCPDGRTCTADADCLFIDTAHLPCTPVGIVGGVCQ